MRSVVTNLSHIFLERSGARGARVAPIAWAVGWLVVLLGFTALCLFVYQTALWEWRWENVWKFRKIFFEGWLNTVWIAAAALALSLTIGITSALLHRSKLVPVRCANLLFVELIRGTPLLTQILLGYYLFSTALGVDRFTRDALGWETDAYLVGFFLLSVFNGAYMSEIFRAGLESVGASQIESARAIGFTRKQTYLHVIFPQMFRRVLPPVTGQLANLIKDSSLLYVISVKEFTFQAVNVNSITYSTLESYIVLAVGYLLLTIPLSLVSRWLEGRFNYET